jgi:thiamine biosynthesis lipoprotein
VKVPIHVFTHEAMAATFEIRLAHPGAAYAAQAAHACFAEIDRLERLLGRFDGTSEAAAIACLEDGESMRVSTATFDCLRVALEVHQATGGAFDPTLGAALDRSRGCGPALGESGPRGRLLLDAESTVVQAVGGRVPLDLGAVGKGFAVDAAGRILREWDAPRALVSAGGSSVLALDGPADGQPWTIGVGEGASTHLAALADRAAGSSGTAVQGRHIIDPATEAPGERHLRTWAFAPTAAEADAYSTAWMVLPLDRIEGICVRRAGLGAIVLPARGAPMVRFGDVPALSEPLGPPTDFSVCQPRSIRSTPA